MNIAIDRWSLLALMRFVLAFIVAVGHLAQQTPAGWLSFVPKFGPFEAVLGFLFISGYSIASSYGKEPEGFLKRRAWRIYPVYLGAIVLACLVTAPALTPELVGILAMNVLFLNQLTTESSFVGPAWSLSLEVWLYCLTPWLWRVKPAHLRALVFGSFAAYGCYEFCRSAFHLNYYSGVGYGLNLPLLAFVWLAGFALARDKSTAQRTIRDCGLIFLAHILLAAAIKAISRFRRDELPSFFEVDVLEFATRGITLAAVLLLFRWIVAGQTGNTKSATMRLSGDISYPFYLVHGLTFTFMIATFGVRNPLLLLAGALLVSLLFFWCLDFYGRGRERVPRDQARSQRPSPLTS